jgi:hypothetical protein
MIQFWDRGTSSQERQRFRGERRLGEMLRAREPNQGSFTAQAATSFEFLKCVLRQILQEFWARSAAHNGRNF